MKNYRLMLIAISALMLSACASQSGSSYERSQTRGEQSIRLGVVESVRKVSIEGTKSGVGAVAGAAVCGLGASNVGGGKGSTVGAVVGAVLGGVAGNAIENATTRQDGLEITVRLENGQLLAVTQAADEVFRPGERVRIVSGSGVTRVTH